MGLLTSQNLVGGTAEIQKGAAAYSFSNKRAAMANRARRSLTKPNAPDKTAAEVFGNEPGQSEGIAPSPWTFGAKPMDNLFMLGDFTSQYGPQGMNSLSDQHMTMLTSFATAVSKGKTDFGGGAGNMISQFMKSHASSYAAKSTVDKSTDGNGVPNTSGGETDGYAPESQYGNGPSGEASNPVASTSPPDMGSPIHDAFVDSSPPPGDTFVAEDQSNNGANDGETVESIAPSGGSPIHDAETVTLTESDGGGALNPQANRPDGTGSGGNAMFHRFMASAAGREAFMGWFADDQAARSA